MIRETKTGLSTIVEFGNGTVRLHPYLANGNGVAHLRFDQCKKQSIGSETANTPNVLVPNTNKVVLRFKCIESLDILIGELQYLKELMENTNVKKEV